MPTKKTNKKKLSEPARKALEAGFGVQINKALAEQYDLTIGQLAKLSTIINDFYYKKIDIAQIQDILQSRLNIDQEKTKKLAKEVLGKRLLIVDDSWFNGEVSEELKKIGVDPSDYDKFVKTYYNRIVEEEAQRIAKKEAAEAEEKAEKKEREEQRQSLKKEKLSQAPKAITKPEEEKKDVKKVFQSRIKDMLEKAGFKTKIDMDVRMLLLLANDETEEFQKELLTTLLNNEEKLTDDKIEINDEKVEPTVANWLKDYNIFVGEEKITSTVKKAQYFTGSENVEKLKEEEKQKIDHLLDLYINLDSFYELAKRKYLDDIEFFTLTSEQKKAYDEFVKSLDLEKGSAEKETKTAEEKEPADIMELYQDKPDDRRLIEKEKTEIIEQTRKEYDEVADIFEQALLNRKKHKIIACLEVLVDIGALDNLLAKDKRFTDLLFGYFNRNNLQSEKDKFKKEPYQAKYIQDFLKFVFLERLGLSENEGARLAANLSNIFASYGQTDYAQLAYLDLNDYKFKWTEL